MTLKLTVQNLPTLNKPPYLPLANSYASYARSAPGLSETSFSFMAALNRKKNQLWARLGLSTKDFGISFVNLASEAALITPFDNLVPHVDLRLSLMEIGANEKTSFFESHRL